MLITALFIYRTLEIRVRSQSSIATELVAWLNKAAGGKAHDGIPANVVHSVLHSSVQVAQGQNAWILEQMPGGHGATFAILVSNQT
jgi:cystathionine gamma-synthase